MAYSLIDGGKRLRPILCLAGAEAVGGRTETALPAAAALEMIHTYSLIHDDLPAMDNDELRRGKSTSHIAFDEATAILAGDALLTLAFQILSGNAQIDSGNSILWLHVINRTALAAGCGGMVEGQMRDIGAERTRLDRDALEKLHALKTGALIEAAVYCGAVLGGGSREQLECLEAYAKCVGLAFQVQDDVLDVEGDPKILGKNTGTDKRLGKSTYPAAIGLKASKKIARQLIDAAVEALDIFDHRAAPLRAIAGYIIERRR
jgi:geranylgeranyl diphosphate synthase type II